jgi:putative oxidoreductase
MSIFQPASSVWTSRMLSVLRVVVALNFMTEGTMKLFGYPPPPLGSPPMPSISLASQLGVAGMLETFGGLCILLGLFTRPVSFILAGEMAVAFFQVHFQMAFWPVTSNGLPAVLFCFIFLYLTFAGGGAWSLDQIIASRRVAAPATEV